MIDMLPESVLSHRYKIGVPDEIYLFEWCPNCSQMPIQKLDVRIDRSNERQIDDESIQKDLVFKVLNGFLEQYRNLKKCGCSFTPPDKQLFQAVLCCEKEFGRIDKHYYIDFLHNNIEEVEYEREMEISIDMSKLLEAIQPSRTASRRDDPPPHFIFIDTETTGIPSNYNAPVTDSQNWPRLVQICWLEYDSNGKEISSNNFIIKPNGFQIPLSSTRIHNISQAFAVDNGYDLAEILSKLTARVKECHFIVGHNIDFDLNIICAELHRMSFANPFTSKRKICTMKSTQDFCAISNSYGYKFPSLQELHHKLFRESFIGNHNALHDINATAKCFWELKRLSKI